MSGELQLRFDYEALDTETRRFVLERAERIHNLARMTATGIVQIGQYLTEVKARLKHGQFLEWIEREFAWGRTSAWGFMQVYDKFKCSDFEHMEIDASAMFLIAAPKTPEPVRSQVIQRAENGETVTHASVRAAVQRFAETGELPEIKQSLSEMIAERRALIQPQSKPPDPSPEAQQAHAEKEALQAKMKANSEHVLRVFNVIGSIECLCGTPLSVLEIAGEIRRLDTPDKDWRRQLKQARQKLIELCKELEQ